MFKTTFRRAIGTACVALLSTTVHAASVVYEVSGDLLGQFLPVTSDPVADLLSLPRGANTVFPATFQFHVNTDATSFILTNTSVGQEFFYTDAVTQVSLIYNGVRFDSIRTPIDEEITIKITNSVAATGNDVLELKLNPTFTLLAGSDLFAPVSVPFNQTIGGQFIGDVDVVPSSVSFSTVKQGALDNADLPTTDGVFDDPTFFALSSIVSAGFGTLNGGMVASGGLSGSSDFSITPVPVPAAGLLMFSAMAGLGFYPRRRTT